MNTKLFITRPVMTTLVMLGLLFFGIASYVNLPVSYLPAVDFPVIQVTATLPGASPKTMASSVASPMERQFSAIAGLEAMSSTSSQGLTTVTLMFELGKDIDKAAMDVQSAITKARGSLPNTMTDEPTFEKVNPADSPILWMAISSKSLPLYTVNDYATTFVTQTISMIPGVAKVQIYGEQKYAVRIQVDPRKLGAMGLGLDQVASAVAAENVNLPMGSLDGRHLQTNLDADGQLKRADKYNPLIVAYDNNMPVRLEDLGRVEDSAQTVKSGSWLNNDKTIFLAIKRQPGSNTIDVVNRIKAQLPLIRRQLPAAIALTEMYDMSKPIMESVNDVKFTLELSVALVVLVVFLFLRNIPGTVISAIAIPFSIVSTFAVMYFMRFTLDNFSLMALTLAVGFVVDDAIVMLENVVRHMEMGKSPMDAALDGAKEIGPTILSMTISLAVVFVPILFMPGIIGKILNEFAVVITAAILVSGVVSLTLTPMLCSRWLKPGSHLEHTDPLFDKVLAFYRRTLKLALLHRKKTMYASGGLFVLTIVLFVLVPKGFLPSDDMGYLFGIVEGPQGVSFEDQAKAQNALTPLILADPDVRDTLQIAGVGTTNQGYTVIFLKEHRKSTADEVLARLQPKLQSQPNLLAFVQNPPMIRMSGKPSKGLYQFTLLSPDTDVLYKASNDLVLALAKVKGLVNVTSDLQNNAPQVDLHINRDLATTLGVSAESIETAMYSAYAGRQISTIYAENDSYKVILELLPEYRQDPRALSLLYVRAKSGKLVRLDALVDAREGTGPITVNHSGQLPAVSISFDLDQGVSLGDAMAKVQDTAHKTLPDTVNAVFEGTASSFKGSMGTAGFLLLVAIVVIYIILGCLYESFIHPITILSGLPSAAMGGLLSLIVFRSELNLYGFVGIIMLIGIVKKNAIMVVDFAIEAEKKGMTPADAAYEGSLVRFRPIMMTTMAAIMGALPIAIGMGAGAQARRPLGLVVVGGLVLSQVVTLYLTPVFYTYMDEFNKFMGAKGFKGLVAHIRNHPRWAWAGALLERGLNRLHARLSRHGWYVRLSERIQTRHERSCARIEQTRDWLSRVWKLVRTGEYESKVDLRQGLRDLVRPKDKEE
ncbi:MAG TPA: efflux RND transporter permease subunit [Humidesulfovibrio sp.]|uniref:efflux RND transporter permease subunit n=1 Tax=Humidesulfovibrio sp. TaxID=2910988 RepID=UPI002BE11A07|nr:efflux RND transporter permease subunit [Humidesulfovibrio sp.]HWR02745.1 efflux RND transporter permease subunit [Humidesulfovibrio sp.]